MSNPIKLVATGTEEFETLIPNGKSRNQTEKTFWNKDFNWSYRNPIENLQKTYEIVVYHYIFICFLHLIL